MRGLSEEEDDFLRNNQGTLGDVFSRIGGGGPATTREQANAAAAQAMEVMADRYPNRVQRLLAFASLVESTKAARDELLTELIAGALGTPFKRESDGVWCGTALQDHEVSHLVEVSWLSRQTVKKRESKIYHELLRTAMIEDGDDPARYGL